MKENKRKIPAVAGAILLLFFELVGAILLIFARTLGGLFQALGLLISFIIMWYALHPLSHFVTASIFGVKTRYFYVGKSEMGKAEILGAKELSKFLVTIGTSLDKTRLASIQRNDRALIFGSGAVFGLVFLLILEVISFIRGFNLISLSLGSLYFLVTLGTELTLSAKSGDISKMKRELSKK